MVVSNFLNNNFNFIGKYFLFFQVKNYKILFVSASGFTGFLFSFNIKMYGTYMLDVTQVQEFLADK